jgi:hypothetical protein
MEPASPFEAPPAPAAQMGDAPYRSSPAPETARPRGGPAPFAAKELAAVLGIALAVDLAFWGSTGAGTGGFGLALLFAAVPVACGAAARRRRRSIRLAVIASLLGSVALRCAIHPTPLTTLSGLALLVPSAIALRTRRSFVPEAIASSLATLAKLPGRAGAAVLGGRRLAARTRLANVQWMSIVVPAALSAVFVGIFALANPVIGEWIAAAVEALFGLSFPPIGRIITWTVALVAAPALVRPAIRLARGSEAASTEGEAASASVVLARNVLVSLNVVFVAYHALDFVYLWTGRPPEGMTTQRYAHAGAFWLTIALALLTTVVGALFRGALAHDPRAKSVRVLAYAWIAQGLVLAVGTYRRIAIHVAHTGLSNLRIVGILGTTLVVIGVVLVAAKLHRQRSFTWIVRRQLDAFALVVVLFALTPTHWIAAHVNVSRIMAAEQGPLLHTGPQSREVESAAVLVPLLDHPDPRVAEGVAALLADERDRLDADARSEWRMGDLWTPSTRAALHEAAPRIEARLAGIDRGEARAVLFELATAAAHDASPLELGAIPAVRERVVM